MGREGWSSSRLLMFPHAFFNTKSNPAQDGDFRADFLLFARVFYRAAPTFAEFTITGSLPLQLDQAASIVASSHMKWATFAMFVLPGENRLLTSPSCSS